MKRIISPIFLAFCSVLIALGMMSCNPSPSVELPSELEVPDIAVPTADLGLSLPTESNTVSEGVPSTEPDKPTADGPLENPVVPAADSLGNHFFQFDLITLQVARAELEVCGEALHKTTSDTLVLDLDLGSSPSGHDYLIRELDSSVAKIDLYQRYETSMSISKEGPHLDLLDWKHHVSEWELLELEENEAMTPRFIPEEYTQFPEVKVREIVKEVKRIEKEVWKTDDRHWSKLAKTIPVPGEYPSSVTISKVYLKMVITLTNGETVVRNIEYNIPMGC